MSALGTSSPPNEQLRVMIDPSYPHLELWGSVHSKAYVDAVFMELGDGISETATVHYEEEQIIGRASSILSYTGVSARQISLVFRFHVQGSAPSSGDSATIAQAIRDEVLLPAKFFEALKFPLVDAMGLAHAPPPVILTIGQLSTMRAVVQDCQTTWQAPWLPVEMLPYGADVSVTFAEVQPLVGNFASRPENVGRWLPPVSVQAVDIQFGKVGG
jgi:hypothetical protein